MKTLNLVQGSQEWLAARAKYFTASEAPAMLGVSKYTTHAALLHMKHTGIAEDVTPAKKRLFDDGHAAEAAARPLAEQIIGEELYPATGVLEVEGLPLLASFDGITMMEDQSWENKLWNESLAAAVRAGELEPHYWAQLEQQLLVSGADRVYFTTSDGTPEKTVGLWYESVPERRAQLIAGWKQFAKDLQEYVPTADAPALTGKSPDTLPALRIEVTGMVTASNLTEFKETALAAIRGVNRELKTDQDFADAEQSVKWCSEVETRLKAAKEHALSQTSSIDVLFKAIDDISGEARKVRLELEKLVKSQKDVLRDKIVLTAKSALAEHIASLNAQIGKSYMSPIAADFAGAIKNKRTLASLQDAADTELARAKIEADAVGAKIQANLKTLHALAADHLFLFADEAVLVGKAPDDLAILVKARIDEHTRQQEERERREQEAKQQAALVAQAKPAEQELFTEPEPAALAAPASVSTSRSARPAVRTAPTLRLGDINERLGFTMTADFLQSLGFEAHKEKSSRLYHEDDFSLICTAISNHVASVARAGLKVA